MTIYSEAEHETGLVAFLDSSQKRRVSALLELGQKRRKDVLHLFYHHLEFDQKYAQPTDKFLNTEDRLIEHMLALGAPSDCYIMSTDPDIDKSTMPIARAISAAYGWNAGTFVSCIPGKLGFFESEDMGGRYLLHRKVGQ